MHSILVVDDNVGACRALARLLTSMGDRAACVNSGAAALEYLREKSPCLIILDVMMPEMGGIEVLRKIRADLRTAHTPVIMFSAVCDPLFAEYAKAEGATDYWVKAAIDYSQLHELVAPYVAELLLH